ncbi:MAG: hypothetical protein JO025_19020 [Verrucomicrobia bacterium]|nr:hypothetical protein [Verrucomicrobiota bacterium]
MTSVLVIVVAVIRIIEAIGNHHGHRDTYHHESANAVATVAFASPSPGATIPPAMRELMRSYSATEPENGPKGMASPRRSPGNTSVTSPPN